MVAEDRGGRRVRRPSEDVVGAEAVHRVLCGWLARLGQTSYEEPSAPAVSMYE